MPSTPAPIVEAPVAVAPVAVAPVFTMTPIAPEGFFARLLWLFGFMPRPREPKREKPVKQDAKSNGDDRPRGDRRPDRNDARRDSQRRDERRPDRSKPERGTEPRREQNRDANAQGRDGNRDANRNNPKPQQQQQPRREDRPPQERGPQQQQQPQQQRPPKQQQQPKPPRPASEERSGEEREETAALPGETVGERPESAGQRSGRGRRGRRGRGRGEGGGENPQASFEDTQQPGAAVTRDALPPDLAAALGRGAAAASALAAASDSESADPIASSMSVEESSSDAPTAAIYEEAAVSGPIEASEAPMLETASAQTLTVAAAEIEPPSAFVRTMELPIRELEEEVRPVAAPPAPVEPASSSLFAGRFEQVETRFPPPPTDIAPSIEPEAVVAATTTVIEAVVAPVDTIPVEEPKSMATADEATVEAAVAVAVATDIAGEIAADASPASDPVETPRQTG